MRRNPARPTAVVKVTVSPIASSIVHGGTPDTSAAHEAVGHTRRGVAARRTTSSGLLLHGPLLDVVGELGGAHSVGLLGIGLEFGGSKLCLSESTCRVGNGLVGPRLERSKPRVGLGRHARRH